MEGKRLGLHHKSLFAVPNSLTEQMGRDFKKLYSAANILVATKKDFEPKNRRELFAKIATGEWDAVIVGHSQFDRMGLSPEREKMYLEVELTKLREEMESAAAYGEKSFSVKKIENSIASYQDKLNKLNDAQVKDDFIDFEKLGFGKLFIDECHMYKNLATTKNAQCIRAWQRWFGTFLQFAYENKVYGRAYRWQGYDFCQRHAC